MYTSGILLSHNKEWNNSAAAMWVDIREVFILSEVGQTDNDKYDTTFKKKIQMNLYTNVKEKYTQGHGK